MKIIDLSGDVLEVTDLQEAIRQAQFFKDLQHTDKTYEKLDQTLNKYWTDIYEKLLQLKNERVSAGSG